MRRICGVANRVFVGSHFVKPDAKGGIASLPPQESRSRGRFVNVCRNDRATMEVAESRETMQAWSHPSTTARAKDPIAVIGRDDAFRRALTREIAALPLPVVTAPSLAEAG